MSALCIIKCGVCKTAVLSLFLLNVNFWFIVNYLGDKELIITCGNTLDAQYMSMRLFGSASALVPGSSNKLGE